MKNYSCQIFTDITQNIAVKIIDELLKTELINFNYTQILF